jgi:hypothetical protein
MCIFLFVSWFIQLEWSFKNYLRYIGSSDSMVLTNEFEMTSNEAAVAYCPRNIWSDLEQGWKMYRNQGGPIRIYQMFCAISYTRLTLEYIYCLNPAAEKDIYFSHYVWNMPDTIFCLPPTAKGHLKMQRIIKTSSIKCTLFTDSMKIWQTSSTGIICFWLKIWIRYLPDTNQEH